MNLSIQKISTSAVLCLCILFSINLSAQIIDGWEILSRKPTIDDLRVVAFVDANRGFVSDGNRTYYTPDFGDTWEYREDLPGANAIEFLGNKGVLANIYADGVYLTGDGGETWTLSTIPGMTYIRSCQYVSEDLITVTSGTSFGYSVDGGASWTVEDCYGNSVRDSFFKADGSGVYVDYDGDIFYSDSLGFTWQQAYSGWNEYFTKVQFANDSVGFAIKDNGSGSPLKTTDGGMTWAPSVGLSGDIIDMQFVSPDTCYAIADYLDFRRLVSTDGSWNDIEMTDLSTQWNYDFHSIACIENKICIVGDDGFILRSWDDGENFSHNRPMYWEVRDLLFFDSNVGIATSGYNDQIFKTYNAGAGWDMIFEIPMSGTEIADISFMNENVGILSTKNAWTTDDYYMTLNGGNSWSVIDELDYQVEDVSLLEWVDGDKWITSKESALSYNDMWKGTYLITGMGSVWTEVYENSLMNVSIVTPDIIFGQTYDNDKILILKSEDGGNTWQDLYEFEEEGLRLSDMEFTSEGSGHCLIDGNQYFRSFDGGLSWDLDTVFFDNSPYQGELQFVDDQYGFVLNGNDIFSTTDGGNTWEHLISDYDTRHIRIYGDYLYRYGYDGTIYRYLLPTLVSSNTQYPNPENWNVFPNPSEGSFTIDIGELDVNRIQILDVQGKIVKDITAFNGNQINIHLSASHSGIYIVRVFSEAQVSAKKVVII